METEPTPDARDEDLEERREEIQEDEGHSGSVPRGNPPEDETRVEEAEEELDDVSGN
jgi:hypothetical protein